jgi:predicted neutral ceramidase superfamily lipid hydrolase
MTSTESRKATSVGGLAILVWSTLAILTTLTTDIPPLQLLAMAFFLAFFIGLLYLRMRGSSLKALLPHPLSVWVLGIGDSLPRLK